MTHIKGEMYKMKKMYLYIYHYNDIRNIEIRKNEYILPHLQAKFSTENEHNLSDVRSTLFFFLRKNPQRSIFHQIRDPRIFVPPTLLHCPLDDPIQGGARPHSKR